jgi:hypothetical protein
MFKRRISLKEKAFQTGDELAEMCSKIINYKKKYIKVAFQVINTDKNVIEYTPFIFIDSLTPRAQKLYKTLDKEGITPKKFLELIIVEGIHKALIKKEKIFDPENNLTKKNLDSFRQFISSLNKKNINRFDKNFQKLIKELKEELGLENSDIDSRKFLVEIWQEYKAYLRKLKNCNNIAYLVRELLLIIPQQSLRTGFTPEWYQIARKKPYKFKIIKQNYLNYLYKIKFWENFIVKLKEHKGSLNLENILKEWVSYNIITNIEFYFQAGYTQGDSILIVFPILRLNTEPFGLFYICINKTNIRRNLPIKKLVNNLINILPRYMDIFDLFLMEQFIDILKKEALNELLIGNLSDISEGLKNIFTKVHNKHKIVSFESFNKKNTYPIPSPAKDKKIVAMWKFRWDLLFSHLADYTNDLQRIKESIFKHALRSAVAAIMSRNMSHNIGSHILFYLKMEKIIDLFSRIVIKEKENISQFQEFFKEIGKIQAKLSQDKIETLMSKLSNLEGSLKNLTSQDIRWGILEWIEDTKTFFGYLQHRMDFLAQVSTEWPKWTFSAYLMKDIIRNFLMQRHLLDGIAKSEGLRGFYYEWEEPYKKYLECKNKLEKKNEKKEEKESGRIKIHVFNLSKIRDERGNEIEKLWNNKQNSIEKRKNGLNDQRILLYSTDNKDSKINIEKDIPIAIPGGVIGYHALYVIIENIIRNSAKHGYTKKRGNKGDLEIVIEFTNDFKEPYNYWRFRIYDNVSKIERKISQNKRFRIFDVNEKNKTPEKDLVAFMNECLRHSLIKEIGEIDKRHWGMAEIKIAAGYLQMRDVQDIGEKDDKITGSMKDQNGEREDFIIRAIESPIETLGFEFKVKKLKEVGMVFYGGDK